MRNSLRNWFFIIMETAKLTESQFEPSFAKNSSYLWFLWVIWVAATSLMDLAISRVSWILVFTVPTGSNSKLMTDLIFMNFHINPWTASASKLVYDRASEKRQCDISVFFQNWPQIFLFLSISDLIIINYLLVILLNNNEVKNKRGILS